MKTILKNQFGLYFVFGSGFVGTQAQATRLSAEDAGCTLKCAAKMGMGSVLTETINEKSFAVCYIRSQDVVGGEVKANVKNPSRRRFASRAGAITHGKRFGVRKASFGAAPGSAGHLGFYVVETNDPVNSAINLKTGLTVPTNGAPKTYAARKAAK